MHLTTDTIRTYLDVTLDQAQRPRDPARAARRAAGRARAQAGRRLLLQRQQAPLVAAEIRYQAKLAAISATMPALAPRATRRSWASYAAAAAQLGRRRLQRLHLPWLEVAVEVVERTPRGKARP